MDSSSSSLQCWAKCLGQIYHPDHLCQCQSVGEIKFEEQQVAGNLHPHLRGEWGQWREGTTGQNDAANTLIHQILHAEAGREAPVTQNVAYKVQRNTQGPFKQVY